MGLFLYSLITSLLTIQVIWERLKCKGEGPWSGLVELYCQSNGQMIWSIDNEHKVYKVSMYVQQHFMGKVYLNVPIHPKNGSQHKIIWIVKQLVRKMLFIGIKLKAWHYLWALGINLVL